MRIDLTVRDDAGMECDIAVLSREPVPFAALQAAAPQLFGAAGAARWVGGQRVVGEALLGAKPLVPGATVGPAPRLEQAAAGLSLDVVGGPDAGQFRPLSYGQFVVGRGPGCDLVLADPDVSREHLRVTVDDRAVTVQDLGSTNGASIDGIALGADAVELAPDAIVQIGESFLALCRGCADPASVVPGPDGALRINRAPSPAPSSEPAVVELPVPLERPPAQRIQWLAALLPAVLGVALALAMRSAQFLLFGLMSPLIVIGTACGDRFHWRRERRHAAADYRWRAAAAERQLTLLLCTERQERRAAQPDPAAVLRMVQLPGAQLWRRGRSDGLELRLGFGTSESHLQIRDGPLTRAAGELAFVPVTLDLARYSVGLAAPTVAATASARWLLGQLAAHHSPADLELAVLAAPERATSWSWLRWLPHFRGRAASTPDESRALLGELTAEIARRRAGQRRQPAWAGRRIVLLVDIGQSAGELAGLSTVVGDAHAVGVSTLCLADVRTALPGGCATVCTASGETGSRWQTNSAAAPVAAVVADRVSAGWAEELARSLAPYVDADAPGDDALPDACRLLELLGLAPLSADTLRARWLCARSGAQTRIGAAADGPVTVDLVKDGPHALVAGTTGSGKSELLQSLVAGLAAGYPPTDLAFVLVDYKGGAAFGACGGLPHVTGLVTDLDAHLTRRALRSLEAELVRRERCFAAARVTDLAGYRKAGRAEPIPRLVIVVDEFAALVEELPAFVTGLVGIARRGRSLGVHLILATQRPGGVVSPEIRANCALRIALRMTDPAESADVVSTDHAATLDPRRPGRAYLDRGRGVELVQVARVSAAAHDHEALRVLPLGPWRRLSPVPGPSGDGGRTDLDLLCAAARRAALDARLPAPARPWLAPLPAALPASALPSATAQECPIGLADLPDRQDQVPVTLDLAAGATVLFTGAARSGRTSALLSSVLTAAGSLSPRELHVHGIDFAGGSLGWLRTLPHTGTVVDHDPATAAALVDALERSVDVRQRQLAASGFGSAAEARTVGDQLTCVLVIIDGWDALLRAVDERDQGACAERLIGILRAAPRAGITVLVAGERATLAPRLTALMSERYVLRMSDPAEYATAGLATNLVPALLAPGHGVRVRDGAEVAFAHAGRQPTAAALRSAAEDVRRRWASAPAEPALIRVRPLPQRIELTGLPVAPGRLTIGVAGPGGEPASIDPFCGSGRLLIAGPGRSGRSTAVLTLLAQHDRMAGGVLVAAPARSPVRAEAARLGVCCLVPDDPVERLVPLPAERILLVDDSEAFLDTPIGEALTAWARAAAELALVVSGRSEELLVTFRGIAAEARRSRCALLLQPGPADLELAGRRAARVRAPTIPGRGLMLGDPAWGAPFGPDPVPIQVALP